MEPKTVNQAKMNAFLARMEERRSGVSRRPTRSALIESLDERFYKRIERLKTKVNLAPDSVDGDCHNGAEVRQEISELKEVLAEYAGSIPTYELKRAQDLLKSVENPPLSVSTLNAYPQETNGHNPLGHENGFHPPPLISAPGVDGFSFRKEPEPAPPLLTRGISEHLTGDSAPGSPRSSPVKAPPKGARDQPAPAPTVGRGPRTVSGLKGQTVRLGPEMDGGDLLIFGMEECKIIISAQLSTLQIRELKGCTVVARPVGNSIMIREAERCIFVVGCQQLRTHSSSDCTFYLYATSGPVIEDSTDIRFAPYNLAFETSGGEMTAKNMWNDVKDFDWLACEEKSPNWNIIPEKDRVNSWSLA